MRPAMTILGEAVRRFKQEGGRGTDWVWFQLGAAERESIDRHLVATEHPLCFLAGTAESRFRLLVAELAGEQGEG